MFRSRVESNNLMASPMLAIMVLVAAPVAVSAQAPDQSVTANLVIQVQELQDEVRTLRGRLEEQERELAGRVQLADGRGLAFHGCDQPLIEYGAEHDDDVARDDDDRELERHEPDIAQRNERGDEQQLVGCGIEQTAQPSAPIEALREEAVEAVRKSGDDENE